MTGDRKSNQICMSPQVWTTSAGTSGLTAKSSTAFASSEDGGTCEDHHLSELNSIMR